MNKYKCLDCQTTQGLTCKCGSNRLWLIGDEHLRYLGVDAYVSLEIVNGNFHILIKKPSGYVIVPLQDQDLLTSFPPPTNATPLTEEQAWNWFEAVEGRPLEEP